MQGKKIVLHVSLLRIQPPLRSHNKIFSSGNSPLDKFKSIISIEFPFIWNIFKGFHKQQILEQDITKHEKKMWLLSYFPAVLNLVLKQKEKNNEHRKRYSSAFYQD